MKVIARLEQEPIVTLSMPVSVAQDLFDLTGTRCGPDEGPGLSFHLIFEALYNCRKELGLIPNSRKWKVDSILDGWMVRPIQCPTAAGS